MFPRAKTSIQTLERFHDWESPECDGGYSAGPPVVVEVIVGIDVVDVVVVVAAEAHRPDSVALPPL